MRLARLYTNKPDIFLPIKFNEGLSAVVAEIRLPENRGRTVHNLGKSTVARLVDFCLLKGKSSSQFLFKHGELFEGFTFFLEAEIEDGKYLTIARTLEPRKPVSFLVSDRDVEDASSIEPEQWDHFGLAFAAARRLLDGLLGFSVIAPYDYRDLMGYTLREQDDYGDVFHLSKFRGKHRTWKPFLAHLLGLNAQLTVELYDEIEKSEKLTDDIARHQRESGAVDDNAMSKIEGLIAIRTRELDALSATLDSFNFSHADADASQELVERVEEDIAQRNDESYRLSQLLWRVEDSLREDAVLFSPDDAAELFREANIAFEGQLKNDLTKLVEFNRAIAEERREYLVAERDEIKERIVTIASELETLQSHRAQLFAFLENSDTLRKYKDLSSKAVDLQADINSLARQRDSLSEILRIRQELRQIQERKNQLQTAIETDIQSQADDRESRYQAIQRYVDEIVFEVLGEHALLTVSANKSTGSLEFTVDVLSASGDPTSAGRGFTYKKLLCIAFDLAVIRAYAGEAFPRFAFHDGVFESLETRAKRRLLDVLRAYARLGLQPVITTLDSDLPEPIDSTDDALRSSEVIRTLTDEGDSGRLFRMPPF